MTLTAKHHPHPNLIRRGIKLAIGIISICLFAACAKNPLTGKKTLAFVGNEHLFAQSFAAYDEFLAESTVIEGTSEALIVERVGNNLKEAAEKWLKHEGYEHYLADYQWEYHLVANDAVNAWCMPGGKIVVYSGILPIAQNEAGLATVMGHELAHALLNHGQQSESADVLRAIGALAVQFATRNKSDETRAVVRTAYDAGSTLLGTLPYSRAHELEADETGLALMTIAGYDPNEAVAFWTRMNTANTNGINFEFLSTHPADKTRIEKLKAAIPKEKAISKTINGGS